MRLPMLARLFAMILGPVLASAAPALAAQPVTISAAASLADALREAGARFEAARPGVTLRFNFAASGVLLQQIVHGAPADLFVSADSETMGRGIEQKLLDAATRRDVASNALVMIAPAPVAGASPMVPPLAQLADLAGLGVRRIAIGKPATVPAGRYAREVLESARLWATLEPKFVFADNVRQALDYVARGETEAGFVYRTDAALMKDKVRIVLTAPGHTPITYPAAVVAGSRPWHSPFSSSSGRPRGRLSSSATASASHDRCRHPPFGA